jgi:hypothetical protein
MIDHGPISDSNPQRLIHRREPYGRIVQFPGDGLTLVESAFHARQRVAVCQFVLDTVVGRGQLFGGLFYQLMYVLALPQHLGEELTRHGWEFRVQISSSFDVPDTADGYPAGEPGR